MTAVLPVRSKIVMAVLASLPGAGRSPALPHASPLPAVLPWASADARGSLGGWCAGSDSAGLPIDRLAGAIARLIGRAARQQQGQCRPDCQGRWPCGGSLCHDCSPKVVAQATNAGGSTSASAGARHGNPGDHNRAIWHERQREGLLKRPSSLLLRVHAPRAVWSDRDPALPLPDLARSSSQDVEGGPPCGTY